MASSRVYIPVSTREYAQIHGISERTARRRIAKADGAVKVGSRWKVPEPASTVAKLRGTSVTSIRKSKDALRAQNPKDLKDVIRQRVQNFGNRSASRAEAHYLDLLAKAKDARPANADAIRERLKHASPSQLARLNRKKDLPATKAERQEEQQEEEWEGDDGESILRYH
jgi:hypothetical protein